MFKTILSKVKNFFRKNREVEEVKEQESERYKDIVRTSIFDSVIAQLNEKANSPKEEKEQTETKIKRTTYKAKAWTWEEWKNYNREQVQLLDKIQQTKLA